MIAANIIFLLPMALCLEIIELRVPDMVDVQNNATMSCKFDLKGERLFSVKWYKDDAEFFRYMPGSNPQTQIFPVKGIHIEEGKCNETSVTLKSLEYATSGTYRCEVSSEAPHFKTSLSQSNMTVLGLPKEDPWIEGVALTYSVGEFLNANCTSSASYPPAVLKWFINSEPAEKWLLTPYYLPKTWHHLNLESKRLGIRFQVDNSYFTQKDGELTLTCTASVAGITRQRETVSRLAQLLNEKYAQERSPRNKGTTPCKIWLLVWICFLSVKHITYTWTQNLIV